MKKTLLTLLASVAVCGGLTSCDNGDNDPSTVLFTYDFNFNAETYNSDGYWKDVYDPETKNFTIAPYTTFSHRANADEYAGVTYYSYKGFCPSRVSDTGAYPDSWTDHQWAAVAATHGAGYLIACWDVMEAADTDLNDRSCAIGFATKVRPVAITVTNTTWGFYAMKDGSNFSKAFGPDDWCKLTIHGVDINGKETTSIDIDMASKGTILDTWKSVDITGLGEVKAVYFTMSSSDSGQWGMNNPAYFALGGMQVIYSSDFL